jgi:hypothetical protein
MLDSEGGSEVIPIHPGRIRFSQGADQLACVRMSDDGLRRWYTSCCRTPVANTHPRDRLPFSGVHRSILSFSGDEVLGPVYARLSGKNPEHALLATLRALLFLAVGLLKGLHRPWPFPDKRAAVGTDAEYYALLDRVKSLRIQAHTTAAQ